MNKFEFNMRYYMAYLFIALFLLSLASYLSEIYFDNLSQRLIVCVYFVFAYLLGSFQKKIDKWIIVSIGGIK